MNKKENNKKPFWIREDLVPTNNDRSFFSSISIRPWIGDVKISLASLSASCLNYNLLDTIIRKIDE